MKRDTSIDLTIMFAVQYRANSDKTLSSLKELICKSYLNINAEKTQWTSAVLKVIHSLYAKHYEYNTFTGLVERFDIEHFDYDLGMVFDVNVKDSSKSFILKTGYKYPRDFIGVRTAANIFTKYYNKVHLDEDFENTN